MKFLCLCHYDQAKYAACTPEDLATVINICDPRNEALHASGNLVAVASLAAPHDYAVIHAADGGATPTVTRGPYATTTEPFGAIFILEADTLEQAIKTACLHPGAHLARYYGGGIEVRPCETYEQPWR